jgi:hypothetical protein
LACRSENSCEDLKNCRAVDRVEEELVDSEADRKQEMDDLKRGEFGSK